MNHTPEPWVLSESHYGAIVSNASSDIRKNWCLSTSDTGRIYSNELAVANARRIVACVNFCAGVSIEKLENSHCGEYQQVLLKERDTYRDLCDELLKNLHDAQNTLAHCKAGIGYQHRQTDTAIKINNAITKAEAILGDKNGR